MKTQPIRRVLHPEIKIIDVRNGICEYIASDETIDSYHEIVRADGWLFDRFEKNAPFVDSHDYSDISKLLGKVIDFKVVANNQGNKQLVETVQWAIDVPENEMAQLGWKMTVGGYLKAVSVGFFPESMVSMWDNDTNGFYAACNELKADPKQVRCIYTKQQQIELSACIIGANPNALAKALKDGAVSESDLMKIFKEPTGNNGSPAHAPGRADEPTTSRARSWFLGKLERAMTRD